MGGIGRLCLVSTLSDATIEQIDLPDEDTGETQMSDAPLHPLPKLRSLPATLPPERAVRLELVEGIPILRASAQVQARVEALLDKQLASGLSQAEAEELDLYAELDDYLSLLNRSVRNLLTSAPQDE